MKDYTHPVDTRIATLLNEKFHLTSLYPFQQLVIQRILEQEGLYGKELVKRGVQGQLIILPTGSGKSVCFTLPAMLIHSITLIIYPLLSLLSDQLRRMEELGEHPVILKGGQSNNEREEIFNNIVTLKTKIVMTTAETLEQGSVRKVLKCVHIGLLVVDEAHVIALWGLSFRPSYLRLRESIATLQPHQILAFTATADKDIITIINGVLSLHRKMHQIKGNIDRENIYYKVVPTLSKIVTLFLFASKQSLKPMIIFFSSRKMTEIVACELAKRLNEPICRYYHAKLDKKEREKTEKWFFNNDNAILCATSAYGMGVDKKNIRCVVHYSLSNDIASFLQESGRGGRDGKPTLSIILIEVGEKLRGDDVYSSIFTESTICRRKRMLELMDNISDHCSGCDVCDNSFISSPLGEKQIIGSIKIAPLRYTKYTLAHHLVATPFRVIFPTSPYYGVLTSWKYEEVLKAIQLLIDQGKIAIRIQKKLYVPMRRFDTPIIGSSR